MHRCILPVITLLLTLALGHADVVVVRDQCNALLPLSAALVPVEEPQIAMVREGVVLDLLEEDTLTCIFTLRSSAKTPLTRIIGFPITYPENSGQFHEAMCTITVNGQRVKPTVRLLVEPGSEAALAWKPDYAAMRYAGFVYWPVTWGPGETKIVSFTTTAIEGVLDYPENRLVDGHRIRYVVRTGALWRGPIGIADICFRVNSDATTRLAYPREVKRVSEREIRWHFTRWTPTDDIWIEEFRWVGFRPNYFFTLPMPYTGATKAYTPAMLDALVEREVAPWRAQFPRGVVALDRIALRKRIAAFLYNEIFARHGYAFIIGPASGPPPAVPNAVKAGDYYVEEWFFNLKLLRSARVYRPVEKTREQTLAEMNGTERANLAFLNTVIKE
jgi:hypothetical protein